MIFVLRHATQQRQHLHSAAVGIFRHGEPDAFEYTGAQPLAGALDGAA
jgi:hypothetical protein